MPSAITRFTRVHPAGAVAAVLLLLGCGARTSLRSEEVTASEPLDAAMATCPATLPWVVYDATRRGPGGYGFVTSLAAMRVDGTERHLLGPMAPPVTPISWFVAFSSTSFAYVASRGDYELHVYAFSSGVDRLLFQRPGSGPSVGPGVLSRDGARLAYMDWFHLTLAGSDGTGSKELVDDCATCIPLAFTLDGSAVWVHAVGALQRVPVSGAPAVTVAAPIVAPPALDHDQARVAAVVQCPGPTPDRSLRIFDIDPGGAEVSTCDGDHPGGSFIVAIGGFGNVSRVAWSDDDWLVLDDDAVLEVVSPARTVSTVDAGPNVQAYNATLAPPCAPIPAGPPL